MAKFSFSNFNKEHKDYMTLEELVKKNGLDQVYQIKKIWINTKSAYNPETPVVEIEECHVNIPPHQIFEVKEMLADDDCVEAIEAGYCGFKIREYEKILENGKGKKKIVKVCYNAEWTDVDPDDFPSYDEDDE